jgi:hypothetical protein
MFSTERISRLGGGGRGTAIVVRRGIDHYAVPVSGLQHLEATAKHIVLATTQVKLVVAYLSPTRSLIESDLSECLSGGFPVLMTGSLLRDYDIRNTCLIYGPESPTTAPYTHKATPRRPRHSGCQGLRPTGVCHCLFCTQLGSPTYPCRHHLPIILSKRTGPPNFTRMGWAASRIALMTNSRGTP